MKSATIQKNQNIQNIQTIQNIQNIQTKKQPTPSTTSTTSTTSKKKTVNGQDLLMQSLTKFYTVKNNINRIVPIITSDSEISLRLIDWFVTNYSKKHHTIITRKDGNNIVHLNVYESYRSQLKAYSKQLFDPFRRRDRISFVYDKDNKNGETKCVETTIGQLNFFRWILQIGILEHITANRDHIENDMVSTQKANQSKRNDADNIKTKVVKTENGKTITQQRKKRNELSKSFIKNMNHYTGSRTINFN